MLDGNNKDVLRSIMERLKTWVTSPIMAQLKSLERINISLWKVLPPHLSGRVWVALENGNATLMTDNATSVLALKLIQPRIMAHLWKELKKENKLPPPSCTIKILR